MARAGSQSQFAQAAADLRCYAGLTLEAREIERVAEEVGHQVEQWLSAQQEQILQTVGTPAPAAASEAKFYISFDGTGVPVRKSELLGRRGKQADGSARTREAKLGCVDRKSTRLNSSHSQISYAVFCLKKKKNKRTVSQTIQNVKLTRHTYT